MKYNQTLFQILLLLTIIVLAMFFYKRYNKPPTYEGFQQQEKFILKTDGDSYDDFYGEIYDELMLPKERAQYELEQVLATLQPEPQFSTMLDVGSGTGAVVDCLTKKGYRVYGIDKSADMLQVAKSKYPSIETKCQNVEEPMAYDRALFTHIFCTNFTIYEIENKFQFFKNCYYWLQNNGYLILHLAEKDKFNTIVPAAKKDVLNTSNNRLLKTEIDFPDFMYSSEYVYLNTVEVVHKEGFTDKKTQNIRQNERTLYMNGADDIIEMARNAGFIAKGGFTLTESPPSCRDKWQQIVILERSS
jgi:cyclopropane fatty-acyl-phospholipid synthase-like methyltransferase